MHMGSSKILSVSNWHWLFANFMSLFHFSLLAFFKGSKTFLNLKLDYPFKSILWKGERRSKEPSGNVSHATSFLLSTLPMLSCMYRQSPAKSPDIKNIIVVTLTFLYDNGTRTVYIWSLSRILYIDPLHPSCELSSRKLSFNSFKVKCKKKFL